MRGLDFFTNLSIAILILGSLAVFAWFLRDALRLMRSFPERDRAEAEERNGAGET